MIPLLKDLEHYQPHIIWTDGEWELSRETWKSTQTIYTKKGNDLYVIITK